MIAFIKEWFYWSFVGKVSKRQPSSRASSKNLKQKTREGTDWALKRYRRTFERLAEFDRT